MDNLAFVLPGPFTEGIKWARGLSQRSRGGEAWPDSHFGRDSNVPIHPSPSRYQCPGLVQPCLNTSCAGGSLPPGWPIHFLIAFTVRQVLCPKEEISAFL